MKKIAILISLAAFVLALASCGGPEADMKKMMKKIEKYTEVAKKAAEDKKLDDKEIEELNKLAEEMNEFEDKMDEKYKDDEEAEKAMEEFEKENEEEIKKLVGDMMEATFALMECEGADKLKMD